MNSHLGRGILLTNFVESMDGYNDSSLSKIEKFTKITDEQLASYVYIMNFN